MPDVLAGIQGKGGSRGGEGREEAVRTRMRRMGIEALYRRTGTGKPAPEHKIYPYLLRDMATVRPNQVWAADITYIPMARGFVYLVVVLDSFSHRTLSWRVSITLEVDFCIEAVEEALARHGKPEIFNTDQGSQFTDQDFTGLLMKYKIAISYGRQRGLPFRNREARYSRYDPNSFDRRRRHSRRMSGSRVRVRPRGMTELQIMRSVLGLPAFLLLALGACTEPAPVPTATPAATQLYPAGSISYGRKPFLAEVIPVTRENAEQLRVWPPYGAAILRTMPGGAAQAAGLRQYDVIVAVNGASIRGPEDLMADLASVSPGGQAMLQIVRDQVQFRTPVRF